MWWLLGCAEPAFRYDGFCVPFDEILLTDPEGVADEDQLEAAADVMAAFATWVDVDTLCLDEVRFTAEIVREDHDVAGEYRKGASLVLVEPYDVPTLSSIVAHELCHALDRR